MASSVTLTFDLCCCLIGQEIQHYFVEDLAKGVCDIFSDGHSYGHSCGVIGTCEENKSCGVGQKVDIPFCI